VMIYRFARLTHALQTSWEIEQCAEHGNARASRAGLIPDHPRPLKGRSRCSAPPSLAPLRRSAARNAQPSHRFRRRAAARPGFRSPLSPQGVRFAHHYTVPEYAACSGRLRGFVPHRSATLPSGLSLRR
jgi:hypothetical protein